MESDSSQSVSYTASVESASEEEENVEGVSEEVSTTPSAPSRSVSVYARESINFVTGPSNSGKSEYILRCLQNKEVFFEPGACQGLIYVHCNYNNAHQKYENPYEGRLDLPTEIYCLDEVELVEVLTPDHVVVLDDLVEVTPQVDALLTYLTHHKKVTLFVVTQSVLNSTLYKILYKAHTLTFKFGNSSSVSLYKHLLIHFIGGDTKAYLRKVFERLQDLRCTVLLKLNDPESSSELYKRVLLLANVTQLFVRHHPYCLVFPRLGEEENLAGMKFGKEVQDGDFVIVEARHVNRERAIDEAENAKADEDKEFASTFKTIVDEVRLAVKSPKWNNCINLVKEILRTDKFIVSSKEDNFKSILIKGNKRLRVSLIDFLSLLTRRSHPKEDSDKFKPFLPYVKILLQNRIPQSFIKNTRLLELASGKERKAKNGRRGASQGRGRLAGFAAARREERDDRFRVADRRRKHSVSADRHGIGRAGKRRRYARSPSPDDYFASVSEGSDSGGTDRSFD